MLSIMGAGDDEVTGGVVSGADRRQYMWHQGLFEMLTWKSIEAVTTEQRSSRCWILRTTGSWSVLLLDIPFVAWLYLLSMFMFCDRSAARLAVGDEPRTGGAMLK